MFILCNLSSNRCTPLRCKVRWRRRGTAGEESGHLAKRHEFQQTSTKKAQRCTNRSKQVSSKPVIKKLLFLKYCFYFILNDKCKNKKYLQYICGEKVRWEENATRFRCNRGHQYSGRSTVNSTSFKSYVGVRWSSFPPAPQTRGTRRQEAYRW